MLVLNTLPWKINRIIQKEGEPSSKRARTENESMYRAIEVEGCGLNEAVLVDPSPPPVVLSK